VAEGVDGGKVAASKIYNETYLYDLDSDPYELANLAGIDSHRGIANRLGEILVKKMVEAGEAAPQIIHAPRRPSRQRRIAPDSL
jgi:hypothetical protein